MAVVTIIKWHLRTDRGYTGTQGYMISEKATNIEKLSM